MENTTIHVALGLDRPIIDTGQDRLEPSYVDAVHDERVVLIPEAVVVCFPCSGKDGLDAVLRGIDANLEDARQFLRS